jgi:hypothetical protein
MSLVLRRTAALLVTLASLACSSSDGAQSSGAGGSDSAGGSSSSGGGCDAVRACCAALSGTLATGCNQAADMAAATGSPAQACAALLSAYQQSGMCGAGGSGGLGGSSGGGGGSGLGGHGGGTDQPAICARYVSCATAATPAGAAAVIAAYGPGGSCWTTTPAVAADCTTACKTGIAQLHTAAPAACPLCLGDAECSGATPACDGKKGQCVACTADTYCPGGACDLTSGVCVECTGNQQCTTSQKPICDTTSHKCVAGCLSDAGCTSPGASHCDAASHKCVECTADGQCAGNPNGPVCNGFTHACGCLLDLQCPTFSCIQGQATCCVAKTCDANACGMVDNGCGGKHDCGACAKGTCQTSTSTCSTLGAACTPGGTDCSGTERCLFDQKKAVHVCSLNAEGKTCLATSDCKAYSGNTDAFFCVGAGGLGKCSPYCVTQADCTGTQTCHMYNGPITTMSPGYCF